MTLLVEIRNQLLTSGNFRERNLIPCTDFHISALMRCQFVNFLPSLYIDFLQNMGQNNPSDFLTDWKVEYDWIVTAKQDAIHQYYGKYDVTKEMFIFAMSDGNCTSFLYFDTKQKGNDPIVYLYDGQKNQQTMYSSSLSAFYQSELQKLLRESGDD